MKMINTQALFQNKDISLVPLKEEDFDLLYAVACDPKIWEQHPNKDRWQKNIFKNFFQGAIESKGAYKIIDNVAQEIVGSTRIYDYNKQSNSILIGYTFIACKYWGSGINHRVKKILLDYLFDFVDHVEFHIGAQNLRSQISIVRLGAVKIDEIEVAYFGEAVKHNYVYRISKSDYTSMG